MEKGIHWEFCKWLKFSHVNKWFLNKLEYILQKKAHRIIWELEIEADLQISSKNQILS